MAALSQLSYSPREQVTLGPVYRRALGVPGWSQAQLDCGLPIDQVGWKQIDPIQLIAIERHGVDLVRRIVRPHGPVAALPKAHQMRADNRAFEPGPFALDAKNSSAQIECQVVATVLGDRLEDLDTQLHRLQSNRCLGDVALVVGGQHPAMLAATV
jgi:hypothetical protein